jgi:4-diphosphocytidyl-2-C-methyl-D-erythritol kinase
MSKSILSLETPSKINIFLSIKGRTPNGYHEIETVFLPLHDIFDKITINFNVNRGIHLTSPNDSIPLNFDNLCYKAAEAYAKEIGITPTLNINIEKNIPIAAGMGGGSSDAAAVLLLLQKHYDNILSEKQLHAIALQLGADVPYFLKPVPALGKGVGEKLTPIPIASGLYIIILAPQFPVSAAWAYKNYRKTCSSNKKHDVEELLDCIKIGDWKKLGTLMHNDLASALYKKFPALRIFKESLLDAGAINAEITGSGPTLFGITDSKRNAQKIRSKISEKYSNSINATYSKV